MRDRVRDGGGGSEGAGAALAADGGLAAGGAQAVLGPVGRKVLEGLEALCAAEGRYRAHCDRVAEVFERVTGEEPARVTLTRPETAVVVGMLRSAVELHRAVAAFTPLVTERGPSGRLDVVVDPEAQRLAAVATDEQATTMVRWFANVDAVGPWHLAVELQHVARAWSEAAGRITRALGRGRMPDVLDLYSAIDALRALHEANETLSPAVILSAVAPSESEFMGATEEFDLFLARAGGSA